MMGAVQARPTVEFDQAINYVNKIKHRFARDERVYKAFLEILNTYRKGQKTINQVYDEVAILFRDHADLLHEFTFFLPDTSQQLRPQPVARGAGRGPGGRGGRGARGGGGRHRAGARGGVGGGGQGEDGNHDRRAALAPREFQFFDRARTRVRSRETFQDFIKCLNLYSSGVIEMEEMLFLVDDVLAKFPELRREFYDLMTRATGSGDPNDRSARMAREKWNEREKFLTLPVSELDLSHCERCTTSYRKLPRLYPRPVCSGRDPVAQAPLLNDDWVSLSTGSEDYSFKLFRKNQYEEALFRCEDDRYELDMAIEKTAATIEVLRPLQAELTAAADAAARQAWCLPKNVLDAINLRTIQRVYGEQGNQILEYLSRNPGVTIPVIFTRLVQKHEELVGIRTQMERSWRRIYEQVRTDTYPHIHIYVYK